MNVRQKIKNNHQDVLKGRFIARVMGEQGKSILRAQANVMRKNKFDHSEFYNNRRFNASEDGLDIHFMVAHRFADMKRMKSPKGQHYKRKAHPIYNRIIFGHLNNIVWELTTGFTDAVIEDMKKLEN